MGRGSHAFCFHFLSYCSSILLIAPPRCTSRSLGPIQSSGLADIRVCPVTGHNVVLLSRVFGSPNASHPIGWSTLNPRILCTRGQRSLTQLAGGVHQSAEISNLCRLVCRPPFSRVTLAILSTSIVFWFDLRSVSDAGSLSLGFLHACFKDENRHTQYHHG